MTPSEVYIEATDTDPVVRAQAEIHRVQQRLLGRLAAPGGGQPAELADFCAGEVRGYLDACDRTLYAAASGAASRPSRPG